MKYAHIRYIQYINIFLKNLLHFPYCNSRKLLAKSFLETLISA